MTAEAGHFPSRSYIAQDGTIHLNGASFFDAAENDISNQLNALNAVSNTELAFIDGATVGTPVASKAVISDSDGSVPLLYKHTNLAAIGSGQANGNTLSLGFNYVTGADNTKCVVLPTPTAFTQVVVVKNATAGINLPVYPQANAAIDAGSANSAANIATLGLTVYYAHNATQWFSK